MQNTDHFTEQTFRSRNLSQPGATLEENDSAFGLTLNSNFAERNQLREVELVPHSLSNVK